MYNMNEFVSSIKVKGIKLLPPLITPERKIELERDKQQAIKLEKRLQNSRNLKRDIDELLKLYPISERPQSAVTYKERSESKNIDIKSPKSTSFIKKKVQLTKAIIDVCEFTNGNINVIEKDVNDLSDTLKNDISSITSDTFSYKTEDSDILNPECNKDIILKDNSKHYLQDYTKSQTPSPQNSPKARLIRSNSYTLEAPSPFLLAHLEKCGKKSLTDTKPDEELSSLSRNWSSLENNYVPFEQSEFNSLSTVYNLKTEDEKSIENIETKPSPTDSQGPAIEVVQTDISVQQIIFNTNTDEPNPIKTTLNLSDPECQLMQVLKKIPEDYSKQIIELIEKQRLQHTAKVDNFEKQFETAVHSTPTKEDNLSTISASPSQSIYYSFGSTDTVMPSLSTTSDTSYINELELPIKVPEAPRSSSESDTLVNNESVKLVAPMKQNYINKEEFKRQLNINNGKSMDNNKREWAARVIGAYVKGYLTRRLFKTDKVQSLIDTIRDALLCALQLHSIPDIEEADIELHRRLINQVTAACYEFHDIFFNLSIPERMSIISKDRKIQIEKARRIKSGLDLRRPMSNSSQASSRSAISLTSSLTKI